MADALEPAVEAPPIGRDLTEDEVTALVGPRPTATSVPSLLPRADRELSAAAASVPQPVAPVRDVSGNRAERELSALGKQPGVSFHEEGLPMFVDLMTRLQGNREEQLRYLAKRFGTENVRLNEHQEPVVRIPNPETGKSEDFPLNPHKITLNSLNALIAAAPEFAGAIVGMRLGGPNRGVFMQSLLASLGAETAGGLTESLAAGGQRVTKPIEEHLQQVPVDVLAGLGLAGVVKGAQFLKGLGMPRFLGGGGINIPNPVAGTPLTQPARPEFTREGVEAAQRLQSATGIDPSLRPSESTGIPLMAMLERYMERKPAGASPQIAASAQREEASKAIQNWMIEPNTLKSDEAVGRAAIGTLRAGVEPLEKDVALAKFAAEAEEKGMARLATSRRTAAEETALKVGTTARTAPIATGMRVADIPQQGVDLAPVGRTLRDKAIAMRDAFKAESTRLYDEFYANPLAKEPVISGENLKRDIDRLRDELPAVTKEVERDTGLKSATGEAVTATGMERVPIITPIRARLDELSTKLEGGMVSINDLKQLRTDLNDAIRIGQAIPGVKEGRLKATESAVSRAITSGLAEIGDPELSRAWKAATTYYRENVDKFTEKNVAKLFQEAEQAGAVGNSAFTKRAITDADTYTALRTFYGLTSPEMSSLRDTVRHKTLSDALGVGGLVDGG